MAIKRRGIVARPGVHKNLRTGQDEVVTWEELKEAVQFQNRIPLVLEHPVTGYINPKDRIGTVTQWPNEKKKVIEGEFWFFDEPEYWGQIPPELKKRIIGGAEMNLSAGYKVGPIVNGRQTCRQYDHIALDVKNPMFSDVGITQGDVRMESELPDDFRIEETPTIEGEKKEEPKKQTAAPVQQPEDKDFWIDYGKKLARLEFLEKQLENKPAAEEPAEEARPETESTPEPEPPKPRTVIPQGSSKEKDGPDDDGLFRIKAG